MEEKKMPGEDEINLLDYLIIITKRKKLILSVTMGIAIAVAVTVFIISDKYDAEVRFLPPQDTSSSLASTMLSQLSGMASLAGGILGVKTPGDTYVAFVSSRTVLDKIVDQFGLVKRYDHNWIFPFYKEDARKKLTDDIVKAESDSVSGVITLTVEEEDPKVAADMANAFLDELQRLCRELSITEASQRRLFYDTKVKETKVNLTKAEDDMRIFQEKTGVLQVDAQAQAVIQGDAVVRAQIAAQEVQINVMKSFSTAQNPDLQKAEESLRGLRAQLSKIETNKGSGNDPLMPTGRMPSVGVEYVRKLRDVKFNETLYELLVKQLELAKLDVARDTSMFQVVDRAVPPQKNAKPKRFLIICVVTFLGFVLMMFVALLVDYVEKVSKDPENKEKVENLRRYARLRFRKAEKGSP